MLLLSLEELKSYHQLEREAFSHSKRIKKEEAKNENAFINFCVRFCLLLVDL